MRKIILSILLVLFCFNADAAVKANQAVLRISGAPITSYAISSGVTVTSDSLYQTGNIGYSSMLLLASGSVTVSYQVSRDGTSWYTPYTTDGSTLTSAGAIASAVTADRWIILPTRLAPYVRYVFVAGSSSTISANLIWQIAD